MRKAAANLGTSRAELITRDRLMALTILTAITVTPSRGGGRYERRLALSMGSIGHLNIALQG